MHVVFWRLPPSRVCSRGEPPQSPPPPPNQPPTNATLSFHSSLPTALQGFSSLFNDHYSAPPALDVKVVTKETSDNEDGFEYMSKILKGAFQYRGKYDGGNPWINEVSPRYGSANDIFTIHGSNMGTHLKVRLS